MTRSAILRFALALVALGLLAPGLSAQPVPVREVPPLPAPLPVRVVAPEALLALVPDTLAVGGRAIGLRAGASVREQGGAPAAVARAYWGALRLTLSAHTRPARPTAWSADQDTVAVGTREGIVIRRRGGPTLRVQASETVVLEVAVPDSLADALVPVAETVDLDAAARLSPTHQVWLDPVSRDVYASREAYASAPRDAAVWVPNGATLRRVFPPAPPGFRLDAGPADVYLDDEPVPTQEVVVRGCYRPVPAWPGPSARERLYEWFNPVYVCGFGLDTGEPEPPRDCLTLGLWWGRGVPADLASRAVPDTLAGRPAFRYDNARGGTEWTVGLDSLRWATVAHSGPGDARAFASRADLGALGGPFVWEPRDSDRGDPWVGILRRDGGTLLAQWGRWSPRLWQVEVPASWAAVGACRGGDGLWATPEGPLDPCGDGMDTALAGGLLLVGEGIRPDEALLARDVRAWHPLPPVRWERARRGRPIAVEGAPAAAEVVFAHTRPDGRRVHLWAWTWVSPDDPREMRSVAVAMAPEREAEARRWLARTARSLRGLPGDASVLPAAR